MDLGQGSTCNNILKTVLLPHHQPAKIELCSPLTSNISIQFHQVISGYAGAHQQIQDPNACVLGVSQDPAQLANRYQQGKSNQAPPPYTLSWFPVGHSCMCQQIVDQGQLSKYICRGASCVGKKFLLPSCFEH